MDEILEITLKGIKEVIKFIVFVIILNIVLLNLGRFTLLAFTLGKYPTYQQVEKDADKIIWFGLFILIGIWSAIAIYNNINT